MDWLFLCVFQTYNYIYISISLFQILVDFVFFNEKETKKCRNPVCFSNADWEIQKERTQQQKDMVENISKGKCFE